MRYLVLGAFTLFLFITAIVFVAFYSSERVAYSPPMISCRIDDDCTQCADAHSIVYGQCANATCVYGTPSICPSLGPEWSAQCINNGVAYCFSAP